MSCCGCIFRVLLLVLLACFTACIVLSNFFPQFRSTTTTTVATQKRTLTYWYQQSTMTMDGEQVMKARTYTHTLQCGDQRRMFVATCSLAVAASGLGALAALFTIFWMLPCCRFAMGVLVFLLTLFAGLCCAGAFGMLLWGFFRGYCVDSTTDAVTAYRADGFEMVEGFVLLCVAGLGFFALALLEAIGYCCASCCCASGAAAGAKTRREGPSEPTHVDNEKEVPSYGRSTSDNTPYANQKE